MSDGGTSEGDDRRSDGEPSGSDGQHGDGEASDGDDSGASGGGGGTPGSDDGEASGADGQRGDGEASGGDGEGGGEPLADVAARVRERSSGELPSERTDRPPREGPLADVATEVDDRRQTREEASDPFESVDVGKLDGEKLWEQLAEGDDGATAAVPLEVTPEAEWDEEGRGVRTISKDTCHGCPHFGDPPKLACTHEGTDILAMTDSRHFRVADCPMVVEEEDVTAFGPDSDVDEDTSPDE